MEKNVFKLFGIIAMVAVFGFSGCAVMQVTTTHPDELDEILREVSDYLNESIPAGRKIAIISIQSDSTALSDYIIDELIANAVNDRNFSVVERQQLDAARAELDFHMSQEVSDESAQSLGQFLGAQTIVIGRVSQVGERFRLNIRALEVETVQVQGSNNWNVAPVATIIALMSTGSGEVAERSSSTAKNSGEGYNIGDTGPGGGLVFYDRGFVSDGWRYMEAITTGLTAPWGILTNMRDTGAGVGTGRQNTRDIIASAFNRRNRDIAARIVNDMNINGYRNWFLPSIDDLDLIYKNLKLQGHGNFSNGIYWSSTILWNVLIMDFEDGTRYSIFPNTERYSVIAVRTF